MNLLCIQPKKTECMISVSPLSLVIWLIIKQTSHEINRHYKLYTVVHLCNTYLSDDHIGHLHDTSSVKRKLVPSHAKSWGKSV